MSIKIIHSMKVNFCHYIFLENNGVILDELLTRMQHIAGVKCHAAGAIQGQPKVKLLRNTLHFKNFKKMKENMMVLTIICSQDISFGDLNNQENTYALSLCVKRRSQISQQQLHITKDLFCVVMVFFLVFCHFSS